MIAVYGATGLVGGRVCAALDAADVPFTVVGRHRGELDKLATLVGAAEVRIADVDHEQLLRAFGGAKLVINCAGPLAEIGEQLLVATLDAGADYVDLGGDQTFLHSIYERHESAARRLGRVVLPGCGLDGAIGDWASAWAAAHVCDVADDGDVVRTHAAPRLAEHNPVDDISISYVFDDLVLSPGSQKAVFGNLHARGVVWRRDRWVPIAAGAERTRVNAGPEMGGERDAVSFPGSDIITVPRHVAARSVQTYISTSRSAVATTALRLLARAMPLVPKRATDLLAPYRPAEHEYARTRFAVIAQVRRGFAAARVIIRGDDLYRASAGIAAWVGRKLAARGEGPVGLRAPSELFRPAAALREVATLIGLEVEPSFAQSHVDARIT